MATILLSAAGAAIGGMTSGTVLGLTGAVIGRAVGATIGRVIDQRLLGTGSEPIEQGRIDRFRITGAGEGGAVAQLFGRMRLGGQVIWATHFVESASTTGGGKGAPPQPKTTTYSYSVSLAIALCEGEIRRVGRVWADGVELDVGSVTMRVYPGREDQMPDPLIEAVEGAGEVPAYRGIAYVVFEDLDLTPFGNRVPQFSFEVVRPARPTELATPAAAELVRAVALMPGTGEYALATRQVTSSGGLGDRRPLNTSAEGGGSDFVRSLGQMRDSLPALRSVGLVYSWFGDDLRAGLCTVRPKVEDRTREGVEMPWRAGGITRAAAEEVARVDGRPVYGGTPADGSILEAIEAIHAGGQEVMFYPFLLMEILAGNARPDPWSEEGEQPALPWRGRITGEKAPGLGGSPDGTAANAVAVDAFFGTATAADFTISQGTVQYSGPPEWSYGRFILHSAALCAAAGGVAAFCIGSEMRGLTQMRDTTGFPAVRRFRQLAAEVRALLPGARLTYAADWSEYFGYQPQDGSGHVFYHLDPLWADPNIDFVGIDNYMPISDWRDGHHHADAHWGSIYDLGHLQSQIEGGEGHDWYYPTEEARAAQRREPITDGFGSEPWIYRYKALRDWWSRPHVERLDPALRSEIADGAAPLGWAPILAPGVEPEGGAFGRYAAPARVSGGDDPWQTIATTGVVACVADQDYELLLHIAPGSAGGFRARISAAQTDDISILSDGSLDPQVVGTALSTARDLEVRDAGGGIFTVRVVFRLSVPSDVTIEVGPGACDPGGDIVIYGAGLTRWPYVPTDWVPRSKPIRFTELGCPAVDKGTNEPNRFHDPKSSESFLPRYSSGRRDDLIQAQYIRAVLSYWDDPERNPVSDLYGGPMLEMDRAHVWAWDARPWPSFPNEIDLWSDGANWQRGHWLTGRIDAVPLAHVVAELCEAAGVTEYDVSALHGLVRGHLSGETESARARVQSLMLAYGFQAVEREGRLVFLPLPDRSVAVIEDDKTALDEEGVGGVTETRAAEAEISGRVRVSYTAAEAAYEERVAEAVFPGDGQDGVTSTTLPMALTGPEGQALAERWLAEARLARDQLRFALPPSSRALGAGALVERADGTTWRIDRVEDRGVRAIEAVRVDPSVFVPSDAIEEAAPPAGFIAPVPVSPVFMDLPLLTGAEVEHAPHLAVTATPWPGTTALYASASADGFVLNRLVERRAVMGTLVTPLHAATPGLWDRGAPFRVRIAAGSLAGRDPAAVLNGANAAAIGSGADGDWEVIQFADAVLVEPGLWEIGLRLRGQQGTDGILPDTWPEGSVFVLLDGAPVQIDLPASARGLARHYRVGPARRSLDDPSYVEEVLAFRGVGMRPYAPAHLRARMQAGELEIGWIRRSRIDGDSWEGVEVPLGENVESYVLRVVDAGGLRREELCSAPAFTYSAAMRATDGVLSPYTIEVAQQSDRFGPGPFARIEIDD